MNSLQTFATNYSILLETEVQYKSFLKIVDLMY